MPPLVREGLIVQWPDTHVPDHHKGAVRSLLSFIADRQPELVLLTGDYLDGKALGRWSADTLEERGEALQHELDEGRAILERLRSIYSGRVVWLPGNHEERLAKWGRTRGKAVFGLRALTVPALLGFAELDIETPGGELEATRPVEVAPGVVAVHGQRLGARAGLSVTKELERLGHCRSVVMGHCHRLAVVYRATADGAVFGVEGGHLMDQARADYLTYGVADWQMGFSTLTVNGRHTTPQVVPMRRTGAFTYEGIPY